MKKYNSYFTKNGITNKQHDSLKLFQENNNSSIKDALYKASIYFFSPVSEMWEVRTIFTLNHGEAVDWCEHMIEIYEKYDFPAFTEITLV